MPLLRRLIFSDGRAKNGGRCNHHPFLNLKNICMSRCFVRPVNKNQIRRSLMDGASLRQPSAKCGRGCLARLVSAQALGVLRKVIAGTVHLFFGEDTGNLIWAMSFAGHLIDSAYNRRRFLVNQPVVFNIRVFSITV